MVLLDEQCEPSSFVKLAPRYGEQPWWAWFVETESQNDPDTNGEVAVLVTVGDVRIADDARTSKGPWAMIIDGDLDVVGDLECSTDDYLVSTLIVTGTVRARNVLYSTSARIGIFGDLIVEGVIVGSWGDASACLSARTIEARMIALDDNTSIGVHDRGVIDAVVKGSRGWSDLNPDLAGDIDDTRLFVPEVHDGHYLDLDRVWERAREGQLPLLPDAERELRARKGLLPIDALHALTSDPRAHAIVARGGGDRETVDVLADRLEELGHVVSHERLAAYVARRIARR